MTEVSNEEKKKINGHKEWVEVAEKQDNRGISEIKKKKKHGNNDHIKKQQESGKRHLIITYPS